jgi:hypothetical protein
MTLSIIAQVSFVLNAIMLSVTNKPFMLIVIMLSVVMLNVVAPNYGRKKVYGTGPLL